MRIHEPVTIKLFDDKKKCQFIRVVNGIKEVNLATGTIAWRASSRYRKITVYDQARE